MNSNPKDKLKGTCYVCLDPAFAWINKKKYCRRCLMRKKHSKLTDKELIKILYRLKVLSIA